MSPNATTSSGAMPESNRSRSTVDALWTSGCDSSRNDSVVECVTRARSPTSACTAAADPGGVSFGRRTISLVTPCVTNERIGPTRMPPSFQLSNSAKSVDSIAVSAANSKPCSTPSTAFGKASSTRSMIARASSAGMSVRATISCRAGS